ncbi:MAG: hypothetical protein WA949_20540 [Phormidesmis sp.]
MEDPGNPLKSVTNSLQAASAVLEQLKGLSQSVSSWWPQNLRREAQKTPLLQYEDLIKYFVEARPNDPSISQGVLIKESKGDGYLILQLFLDDDCRVVVASDGKPYGRRILTERLDQELVEAFNNKDMIIVK